MSDNLTSNQRIPNERLSLMIDFFELKLPNDHPLYGENYAKAENDIATLLRELRDRRTADEPRAVECSECDAIHENGRDWHRAWCSKSVAQPPGAAMPKPINHDLWRHLHDEHGLTLLQSELDEILRHAQPPPASLDLLRRVCDQSVNGRRVLDGIDKTVADEVRKAFTDECPGCGWHYTECVCRAPSTKADAPCGEDIGFGMRCKRARGHAGPHAQNPKVLFGEEPVETSGDPDG